MEAISAKVESSNKRLVLDPTMLSAEVDGKAIELTVKEWQLLFYLFLNSGRLITREEIRAKFKPWGETSDNNLDVYVSYLRKKIGGDFIKTVRGQGFVFME